MLYEERQEGSLLKKTILPYRIVRFTIFWPLYSHSLTQPLFIPSHHTTFTSEIFLKKMKKQTIYIKIGLLFLLSPVFITPFVFDARKRMSTFPYTLRRKKIHLHFLTIIISITITSFAIGTYLRLIIFIVDVVA